MPAHDILRVGPEEIRARRAKGEAIVFVDVRTMDARQVHPEQIPGSHWLPLADVTSHAASLPSEVTLVTY